MPDVDAVCSAGHSAASGSAVLPTQEYSNLKGSVTLMGLHDIDTADAKLSQPKHFSYTLTCVAIA